MYDSLTYKWANTLFALISVAMIPIPFVSSVPFFFLWDDAPLALVPPCRFYAFRSALTSCMYELTDTLLLRRSDPKTEQSLTQDTRVDREEGRV